eukprot:UN01505
MCRPEINDKSTEFSIYNLFTLFKENQYAYGMDMYDPWGQNHHLGADLPLNCGDFYVEAIIKTNYNLCKTLRKCNFHFSCQHYNGVDTTLHYFLQEKMWDECKAVIEVCGFDLAQPKIGRSCEYTDPIEYVLTTMSTSAIPEMKDIVEYMLNNGGQLNYNSP